MISDSVFEAARVIHSHFSHNNLIEHLLEPTRHEYLSLIYRNAVFGKLRVQQAEKSRNQRKKHTSLACLRPLIQDWVGFVLPPIRRVYQNRSFSFGAEKSKS